MTNSFKQRLSKNQMKDWVKEPVTDGLVEEIAKIRTVAVRVHPKNIRQTKSRIVKQAPQT